MAEERIPRCARCESKECTGGKDCFGRAAEHGDAYGDESIARIHRAASAIEARHYGRAPRLEEIGRFAKELGATRIGLAFCVGLSAEARIVDEILREHFDVVSVCCKACGLGKGAMGLETLRGEADEVMCNPAGQADLLDRAGSGLNVIIGLCVGHDAIFSKASKAPVTTLVAKDRVLAHNPAGAIWCSYVRKRLFKD